MNKDVLLTPVPVRFSQDARRRINKAARRFHLRPSDIIRQAVENQLAIWESERGLTIHAGRS